MNKMMNIAKAAYVIQTDVKNFGVFRTAYDISFRAINRLVYWKALRCMAIDTVDPSYLKLNSRYECKFLEAGEVLELATNSEFLLPRGFLLEALGKGDQCFGIIDGDRLASYGWYSNQPTPISNELSFYFNRRYVYMYRGFTHPSYRGQRLHAIGMTKALSYYLNRGFKGLVAYVEDNNFGSLKSVYRMGYRDFGKIYILGCFGKYLIHCNLGCKDYQVSVAQRGA